ncbi:MAG: putative S-layer protein [Nanoarchaeota archaeon]
MFRKLLISILAIMLFAVLPVAAVGDLTITNAVGTTGQSVNPEAEITGSFDIKNGGISSITNIGITATDLVFGTNKIPSSKVVITPNSVATLDAGLSKTITFTLKVPVNQIPGLYAGNFEAKDVTATNSAVTDLSITVKTLKSLNVVEDVVTITGEDGEAVEGVVTMKNTGNVDLTFDTSSIIHDITLTDNDEDEITLFVAAIPTSIVPGEQKTFKIKADFETGIDVDTYSGEVTITSKEGAVDKFNLELNVQPEVCEKGIVGNLEIDLQKPDNGDDFSLGETVSIEVKVDNEDDSDLDVEVEAFLYNVDENSVIERVTSDSLEVREGENEDFNLDLDIPFDSDINEDDEYILYVKAYENGDEDKNCAQDQIDIGIDRQKDDVRVENVLVTPSTAACGEVAEFVVDVINVGSNDQRDVHVELINSELGIKEQSEEFDIDKGSDPDNDAKKRFTFTIPNDAEEKTYSIEGVVVFDDGNEKNSEFVSLNVLGCGETPVEPPVQDEEDITIQVLDPEFDATGKSLSIPTNINNNLNVQKTLHVSLANVDDWTTDASSEKVVTLKPGQMTTLYFYITVDDDSTGLQTATLNVKDTAGSILVSDTFSVELNEDKVTVVDDPDNDGLLGGIRDFTTNSNVLVWVIADIILVVVVVLLLKFLFSKK